MLQVLPRLRDHKLQVVEVAPVVSAHHIHGTLADPLGVLQYCVESLDNQWAQVGVLSPPVLVQYSLNLTCKHAILSTVNNTTVV